jgi:hypothetical protein
LGDRQIHNDGVAMEELPRRLLSDEGSQMQDPQSPSEASEEDALAPLNRILEWSTQHAHFLPADELPEDGRPGPFPPSRTTEVCPACGTASGSDVPAHEGNQSEGVTAICCPLEDCEKSETRWNGWDELWRHQVASGHVVCRKREWLGNLENEFSD